MKAIDFRNATFEGLRAELPALRAAAYAAWVAHGPGTTRQVAACSGMDILTFRPRSTELLQMGLIRVRSAECGVQNGEGVYEVTLQEEWERFRDLAVGQQLTMI